MNKGSTYNKGQQALITCNNILYEGGATLDKILYPIGSIYMSVNSTNPSQLFGGTWEQISGRFLYCTTTSKTTGGDTVTGNTTLTVKQIPAHKHTLGFTGTSADVGTPHYHNYGEGLAFGINNQRKYNRNDMIDNTGGGQGHSHPQNLPPYFTVYCWYRVS